MHKQDECRELLTEPSVDEEQRLRLLTPEEIGMVSGGAGPGNSWAPLSQALD